MNFEVFELGFLFGKISRERLWVRETEVSNLLEVPRETRRLKFPGMISPKMRPKELFEIDLEKFRLMCNSWGRFCPKLGSRNVTVLTLRDFDCCLILGNDFARGRPRGI